MSKTSLIREHLSQLDLEGLVRKWSAQTGMTSDELKEQALRVLVKMLEKEQTDETFGRQFEDQRALQGYLYVCVIRAVRSSHKQSQSQQHLLQQHYGEDEPVHAAGGDVEQKLWASQIIEKTLLRELRQHATKAEWEDCVALTRLILARPSEFLVERTSGKAQGTTQFHHTRLAEALSWSRVRSHKRCQLLREAFFSVASSGY